MFEALNRRLETLFRRFGDRRTLSEKEVDQFLAELRRGLLAGDVHLDVVTSFLEDVRGRAVEQRKIAGVTATEQLLSIVGRRLVECLGGAARRLNFTTDDAPVYMLVGLQGTGKTTTASKLAHLALKRNARPLLVPLDWKRPAAVEQLRLLAGRVGAEFFAPAGDPAPVERHAQAAAEHARRHGLGPVILDTAGRLHVDPDLMDELRRIRDAMRPVETLFVADGASGQDAAVQARAFEQGVGLTGVILTKMDGDARGGAALSIRTVTGRPIVAIGTGEEPDALEDFHPDRIASRILGAGDLDTLFERVQERVTQEKEERLRVMLETGRFTMYDFRDQLRDMTSFGPLENMIRMIPGMGRLVQGGADWTKAERDVKRTMAVIDSMTHRERENPLLLNGPRRRRIARGSGTGVDDVNRVIKQYDQFKRMFKEVSRRGPGRLDAESLMQAFRGRSGPRL